MLLYMLIYYGDVVYRGAVRWLRWRELGGAASVRSAPEVQCKSIRMLSVYGLQRVDAAGLCWGVCLGRGLALRKFFTCRGFLDGTDHCVAWRLMSWDKGIVRMRRVDCDVAEWNYLRRHGR